MLTFSNSLHTVGRIVTFVPTLFLIKHLCMEFLIGPLGFFTFQERYYEQYSVEDGLSELKRDVDIAHSEIYR